jgi:hypothetical protein
MKSYETRSTKDRLTGWLYVEEDWNVSQIMSLHNPAQASLLTFSIISENGIRTLSKGGRRVMV